MYETLHGIGTHVAMVVGFLLAIILLAYTIRQKLPPATTLAWLLAIIFVPYVAVPLYIILGGRKSKRRARMKTDLSLATSHETAGEPGPVQRLLDAFNMPPAVSGNRLRLCDARTDGYEQLTDCIDRAKRTIHIETYIFEPDDIGRDILNRLARRAGQGVTVRLLLDAIGSHHMHDDHLRDLRNAGGSVGWFMPVLASVWHRRRVDLRNHRKIFVADDRFVVAGGANISADYLGPKEDPRRWVDLSFGLEGPAAGVYAGIFRQDWRFATGEDIPVAAPAEPIGDDTLTQVVPSGPDVPDDALYAALLTAAYEARERLWIVTPYFVPDESLVQAFTLASRRGVDVRLVVPAKPDQYLTTLARRTYLRQLKDVGATVLLYQPRMLHAKAVLVDRDLAVIGSPNMDIRSLLLNYEAACFVYNRQHIDELAEWIEQLFADCTDELPDAGCVRRLIEDTARILSPLL
ncbi:MAG: cardiolipin synthase [Planctomycetes bacterium]|jgi:cardiolipin synthase|nr:PLDc N-terminal domain-containing protein [Phycisphaerae bacterium]NBB95790.1 cardiolipin synthase [Planctomycetota bacterium]